MNFKIKNKALWFGLCLIITFGLIMPLQPAQAGLGDIITGALTKFITGTIDVFAIPLAILLMLAQLITGILPMIAAEVFKSIIAISNTIPLVPTSGGTDMVSVGWQFTRDFANMLFILILAWVGFATILRLQDYEVKKIIPKLLFVALLVNFIPVICGVILDISNILTFYFTSKSTNVGALLWEKLPALDVIKAGATGLKELIPGTGGISGMAVKSLMGIVFNLIAFFMLSLYTILFVIRIVAIWILLVLAPLAWIGYIIPFGKKWWDDWWKQFIQWSIIGVFLGFFLYLSGFTLTGTSFAGCSVDMSGDQYGLTTQILTSLTGGLICNTLPFIAAIVVMLVGFMFSISFAPKGASAVFGAAKKGGIAASKVLGTQGLKIAKDYAKHPGQMVKDYRTGRVMGLSARKSLGATMSKETKRTRQQWSLPVPEKSIQTYNRARALGIPKTEAVKMAARRLGTWTPGGKNTKAVVQGFKNAAKAGWGAGTGAKAKKKGFRPACPTCGNPRVSISSPNCPACGHVF